MRQLTGMFLLSSVLVSGLVVGPSVAEPEIPDATVTEQPETVASATPEAEESAPSATPVTEATAVEPAEEETTDEEPFVYIPEYREHPYPFDDPTVGLPNPALRARTAFRAIPDNPFTCGDGKFVFISTTGAMSQVNGDGTTDKQFPAMPSHFRTFNIGLNVNNNPIPSGGLPMTEEEYNFWNSRLSPTYQRHFRWYGGRVYSSNLKITYGLNTTVNSIGVSKDGEYAYALANHSSQQHISIYRYDNSGWQETPVKYRQLPYSTAGAINLENGNYYFGGYSSKKSDPQIFSVYRYDVNTHDVSLAAEVPMKYVTESPNGDMSFDSLGNLTIVRSDSLGDGRSKPTLYTINKESLRNAETSTNKRINDAVVTDSLEASTVSMSGIAFDDDGQVYLSGGKSVVKYNQIAETSRSLRDVDSATNTTDIATCAEPPTIEIKKNLPDGFAPDDTTRTFNLKLLSPKSDTVAEEYGSGDITAAPDADKKRLAAKIAAQTVGPFVVPADTNYNLTETAGGTYFPQWSCVDQTGTKLDVSNLSLPGQVRVHLPDWVSVGAKRERPHVTCTVRNDSKPQGYLAFTKKVRGVDGNLRTVENPRDNWPFEAKLAGGTAQNGGLAQFQTGNTGEAAKAGVGEATLNFDYIRNYKNGANFEFGETPESLVHTAADDFQNNPEYTFVAGTARNNTGSFCEYTPYFKATETFPLTKPYATISELTNRKYTVLKPGDKLECTFINKQVGSITLKTYDADASTAANKVALPGVVYELWSSTDNRFDKRTDTKVGEVTADANGIIKWTELDLDKHYFLREKSHPEGYHNVPTRGKDTDYLMEIDLKDNQAPRAATPHVIREVALYRNRYVLKWRKVDHENPDNLLAGSGWGLTETTLNEDITVADCVNATHNCADMDRDGTAGIFRTKPLAWGTYKLEETQVPTGYYPNMPVEVKINKDGTIALRNLRGSASQVTAPLYGAPSTETIRANDSANVTRDFTMFTFDIGNKPNRNKVLTWEKVDGLNDKLLAGSSWTLITPDGEVEITDCVGRCAATSVSNTSPVSVIYRDNDPAAGKFRVEKLKAGTYGLQERTAPTGYVLKKTAETSIEHTDNDTVKSFGRIANNPITIPSLPLTGGTSTDAFIIAAGLVFALATGTGAQAYRRRRA